MIPYSLVNINMVSRLLVRLVFVQIVVDKEIVRSVNNKLINVQTNNYSLLQSLHNLTVFYLTYFEVKVV